jgi:hypothetical protein
MMAYLNVLLNNVHNWSNKPLTHYYNITLNSDVFPNEWTITAVKSLYKKAESYDNQNYKIINSFYLLEEYFTWNSNRDLGSV